MGLSNFLNRILPFVQFSLRYLAILTLSLLFTFFLSLNSFFPVYYILIALYGSLLLLYPFIKTYWNRVYPRLLLATLSGTFTLLAMDGFLRIRQKNDHYRPSDSFITRSLEYPDLLYKYKPEVYYKGSTYGDLVAMSGWNEYREQRPTKFETDLLGYRNSKGHERNKNQYLLIGDSFCVGVGTHQKATFAYYLAQKRPVYNLSFPGDPLQELVNLMVNYDEVGHVEQPTILWFIFTGNDTPDFLHNNTQKYLEIVEKQTLEENAQNSALKHFMTKASIFLRKSPLRNMISRIRHSEGTSSVIVRPFGQKQMLFLQAYADNARMSHHQIREQDKINQFRKVFELGKNFSIVKNAKLKVFLIPTKYEVYQWVYDKKNPWEQQVYPSGFSLVLQGILNDLEIPYIDAKPFLIQKAKTQYAKDKTALWWLDDTHFNAHGHLAMNELIETSLP